ncbi:hypothetical protein ACWDYH_20890 [Nocardia goodfellowii]
MPKPLRPNRFREFPPGPAEAIGLAIVPHRPAGIEEGCPLRGT